MRLASMYAMHVRFMYFPNRTKSDNCLPNCDSWCQLTDTEIANLYGHYYVLDVNIDFKIKLIGQLFHISQNLQQSDKISTCFY